MRLSSTMVVAATAAAVAGCASMDGIAPMQPSRAELAQAAVERAWPYAQLAYNAYHRELLVEEATPFTVPGYHHPEHWWYGNDAIGLAMEVVERAEPFERVFVFRGTEGSPKFDNCDWRHSNLYRWRQQGRALALVKLYNQRHPLPGDRKVGEGEALVFVGHSLGGAVANQLSIAYPRSTAYLFDPSPQFDASGSRESDKAGQERRMSVVNRGEFLYAARGGVHRVAQTYLSLGCGGGLSPVRRHSMHRLAGCLTQRAQSPSARQSRMINAAQLTEDRHKLDPTNPTQICRKDDPIPPLRSTTEFRTGPVTTLVATGTRPKR